MRTKLKDHDHDVHIYGIRVFREDIEEIIDTLKYYGFTVKIEFNGFAYENIDELKDYSGLHPNKIKLSATNKDTDKDLSVNFNQGTVHLYSLWGSDIEFFKIREILNSKSSVLGSYLDYWLIPVIILLGLFYGVAEYTLRKNTGASHIQNIPLANQIVLYALLLIALVTFVIGIFRHSFLGAWLSKRHEGGFWRKNKDQVLTAFFSAVFGVLGTLFIQWLQRQ